MLTQSQEMLRKDDAWAQLSHETRSRLCALLPDLPDIQHDPDVNPLWASCAPYIEKELRSWQDDLREGRESQKWRTEAIQAGRDRQNGKFADWEQLKREEWWGDDQALPSDSKATTENATATNSDSRLVSTSSEARASASDEVKTPREMSGMESSEQ